MWSNKAQSSIAKFFLRLVYYFLIRQTPNLVLPTIGRYSFGRMLQLVKNDDASYMFWSALQTYYFLIRQTPNLVLPTIGRYSFGRMLQLVKNEGH